MKKKLYLGLTIGFFALFVIFTLLVKFVDVKAIGPNGSSVGFASINEPIMKAFGYNKTLDKIGDISFFAIFVIVLFVGVVAVIDLIKKKTLKKVQSYYWAFLSIMVLLIVFYVLFYFVITVNCRPVLDNGKLLSSYPSSHVFVSHAIALTSIGVFQKRFCENKKIKLAGILVCSILGLIILITRVLSGMHWFTDIVGGIILGLALYFLFCTIDIFVDPLIIKD